MRNMTVNENIVLHTLANAWNEFLTLPELYSSDKREFQSAIHLAQNLIIARPYAEVTIANRGGQGQGER